MMKCPKCKFVFKAAGQVLGGINRHKNTTAAERTALARKAAAARYARREVKP